MTWHLCNVCQLPGFLGQQDKQVEKHVRNPDHFFWRITGENTTKESDAPRAQKEGGAEGQQHDHDSPQEARPACQQGQEAWSAHQDALKDRIRSGRRPSPRGRQVGRCCSGRLPSRAPHVSGARSHDTRARHHSPMPTSMWPAAELRGDKSAKAARAATKRVRK